jgi:hypothetical protein
MKGTTIVFGSVALSGSTVMFTESCEGGKLRRAKSPMRYVQPVLLIVYEEKKEFSRLDRPCHVPIPSALVSTASQGSAPLMANTFAPAYYEHRFVSNKIESRLYYPHLRKVVPRHSLPLIYKDRELSCCNIGRFGCNVNVLLREI